MRKSAAAVDRFDGQAEFVGQGLGGDEVVADLDLDGAVARAVLTNLRMDQPAWSIQRLTARAASTIVGGFEAQDALEVGGHPLAGTMSTG